MDDRQLWMTAPSWTRRQGAVRAFSVGRGCGGGRGDSDSPLRRAAHLLLLCGLSLLWPGSWAQDQDRALTQDHPQPVSTAQPELDRLGRSLLRQPCRKPQSVKRERVPNPVNSRVMDAVWTTRCDGVQAIVLRPGRGGRGTKPMELSVSRALEGLAPALAVGSTAQALREALGPPWETRAEGLVYALSAERPFDDQILFRVEAGRVVELVWHWEVD